MLAFLCFCGMSPPRWLSTFRIHCRASESMFCFDLQKELLRQILKLGLSVPNVISKSVSDQFELCLVKCRTSSKVSKLFYLFNSVFQ